MHKGYSRLPFSCFARIGAHVTRRLLRHSNDAKITQLIICALIQAVLRIRSRYFRMRSGSVTFFLRRR